MRGRTGSVPARASTRLGGAGGPCPQRARPSAKGYSGDPSGYRLAARLGGSDLGESDVLAHNRLALPRSAACV
eukprot:6495821-Prymnesium_polylepis.1